MVLTAQSKTEWTSTGAAGPGSAAGPTSACLRLGGRRKTPARVFYKAHAHTRPEYSKPFVTVTWQKARDWAWQSKSVKIDRDQIGWGTPVVT